MENLQTIFFLYFRWCASLHLWHLRSLKLLVMLTGLCFLHFRSYMMYSEWVSLRNTLQRDQSNRSVLQNFPPSVGKDVAHTVVKTLVNSGTQESLRSEKEVDWIMEVLCYGLTTGGPSVI